MPSCQLHDLAASFAAIEPTFSGQSDDFERACSDFGMIFSILSQIVIQLAISQQSAIGGDRRAAGPDHQAPVEIEPQRAPIRSPWLPRSIALTTTGGEILADAR